MLSSELEYCLNEAFQKARDARHEYMTVEHLLLSILDAPRVREILKACGADLTRLQADLQKFVDETTPTLAADDEREVQPTLGFQRVLQRAVFHVQSSGKKEVAVANVLVAIFSEKQSHAAYLLSMQDIARLDVVNYISHGLPSSGETRETPREEGLATEREGADDSGAAALEKYTTNLNAQAKAGRVDPLIGRQLEVRETKDRLDLYQGPRVVASHATVLGRTVTRVTVPEHRPPRGTRPSTQPSPEDHALAHADPPVPTYAAALKQRSGGRGTLALRRLLALYREYPRAAFLQAVTLAAHYGLFDLDRLERLTLRVIAKDYFLLADEDEEPQS